jgi:hypothetical protein
MKYTKISKFLICNGQLRKFINSAKTVRTLFQHCCFPGINFELLRIPNKCKHYSWCSIHRHKNKLIDWFTVSRFTLARQRAWLWVEVVQVELLSESHVTSCLYTRSDTRFAPHNVTAIGIIVGPLYTQRSPIQRSEAESGPFVPSSINPGFNNNIYNNSYIAKKKKQSVDSKIS